MCSSPVGFLRGYPVSPRDEPRAATNEASPPGSVHGTSHTHIQRDNVPGAQGAFVPSTSHDADSFYELVLTATDSKGLTGTARVVVRPETVSFTLDSAPAGAPLTYGGDAVTAPSTRRAAVGFATSVSAAERFERDGRT